MFGFSQIDLFALVFFVTAWAIYHVALAREGEKGVNGVMGEYRLRWMMQMSQREVRIMDSAIMASLQNGTAFSPPPPCWRSAPAPLCWARSTT